MSKEHADFVVSLGFLAEKVHYIPNGIDTNRIVNSFCVNKPERFLMFGWDVIRKGVDLVINAEALLHEEHFEVVVVGQEACEKYLMKTPTEHIQFCYPVNDVNKLYKTSKTFLHVSRAEGLSYALLEVIYAGLNVICSDIPENQVAKEFSGVRFVHMNDFHELALAMKEMINHENELSKLEFDTNRSIINKKYSLNAWAEQVLALYFEIEEKP